MSPPLRALVAGLVSALSCASCTGGTPCDQITGSPVIVVGSGNPNNPQLYRPLVDGDTVTMVPGNQGGQHVWIQIHARNFCPTHPSVRLRVYRVSDNQIIGFSQYSGNSWTEVPGSPGTYTSPPYAASIEQDKYCTVVHGGAIRVDVLVDDTVGHSAEPNVTLNVQGWSPDALESERTSREACCADYTNTNCWPLGAPDAAVDASSDIQDIAVDAIDTEAAAPDAIDAPFDASDGE